MIGYRAWVISGQELSPLYHRANTWRRGLNIAVCAKPEYNVDDMGTHLVLRHVVLDDDCHCGFWFRKTVASAIDYVKGFSVMYVRGVPALVIGAIETYGKHMEHEIGMRCEKAQIIGLYEPEATAPYPLREVYAQSEHIHTVARMYDVPVTRLDTNKVDATDPTHRFRWTVFTKILT